MDAGSAGGGTWRGGQQAAGKLLDVCSQLRSKLWLTVSIALGAARWAREGEAKSFPAPRADAA